MTRRLYIVDPPDPDEVLAGDLAHAANVERSALGRAARTYEQAVAVVDDDDPDRDASIAELLAAHDADVEAAHAARTAAETTARTAADARATTAWEEVLAAAWAEACTEVVYGIPPALVPVLDHVDLPHVYEEPDPEPAPPVDPEVTLDDLDATLDRLDVPDGIRTALHAVVVAVRDHVRGHPDRTPDAPAAEAAPAAEVAPDPAPEAAPAPATPARRTGS